MSSSVWPHRRQPTRLLCPWRFSRQEYWTGLPWSPPGDLANPWIEPRSPALRADSLPAEPWEKPKCHMMGYNFWFLLVLIFWMVWALPWYSLSHILSTQSGFNKRGSLNPNFSHRNSWGHFLCYSIWTLYSDAITTWPSKKHPQSGGPPSSSASSCGQV